METLPKRAPATTLGGRRRARRARVPRRAPAARRAVRGRGRARATRPSSRGTRTARGSDSCRCAIVEQWSRKSAKIATVATNAHLTLRAHEEAFAKLADGLFHLHQQIEWAKAPAWDLAGALNVLCDGDYELGREISEIGVGRVAAEDGGDGGDGGDARAEVGLRTEIRGRDDGAIGAIEDARMRDEGRSLGVAE